jgi:catechol 2,3-dioxygenase-like lactoylglutathione lyase family enzyme
VTARLEHANLSVHDLDGVIRFLRTAFPDFQVRRDATGADGRRWVHVGTNDTYVALSQAAPESGRAHEPYQGHPGLNHLAFEVADVVSVRDRLQSAGYRQSAAAEQHTHRTRIYFLDPEDNDWEFVQYLADDPALRHDYALPDPLGSMR